MTGGFAVGGMITAGEVQLKTTQKYDDTANTWTTKQDLGTAAYSPSGFWLKGYGYKVGGFLQKVVEKYDDNTNTWTVKQPRSANIIHAGGFQLNGYGYVAGGYTENGAAPSNITEKYDDVANSWTIKQTLTTARSTSAFSLNGFGYTAGGYTGANSAVTEKYDDLANTWTTKQPLTSARRYLTGFSLNGYGYTAGGLTTTVTEKYDDTANTWTTKQPLNTARGQLCGFNLNGYGYTAGGCCDSAVTEKYDDVANTWTAKANLNTATRAPAGFAFSSAPTVTNVSSTTANGTYSINQTIAVTITFSAPVTVTGTPQIDLETGAINRQATYSSGSGTTILVFNYTVMSGDNSSHLDYVSDSSLTLNGGTIKDGDYVNTVLTLPVPGAAGSLGANKNIVIRTSATELGISPSTARGISIPGKIECGRGKKR